MRDHRFAQIGQRLPPRPKRLAAAHLSPSRRRSGSTALPPDERLRPRARRSPGPGHHRRRRHVRGARLPGGRPGRPGRDARSHPGPRRARRRRGLGGVPRGDPAQAGPGADRRPRDPAVLRPARPAPRRTEDGERFYIGRRHVHDDDGDPVVIDWRADVSTRVLPGHPRRADGRRAAPAVRLRAGPHHRLRGRAPARPHRGRAPQPRSWPARSSGPASARCATSSPPSSPSRTSSSAPTSTETVCVQGAPGTGKTAVGLHRAAYLLYAYRDRLRRGGVLVVGPNTRLPLLHLRGPARARRGRRAAGDPRRAGRRAGADPRRRAGATSRPSRATRGWRRCCAARCTPVWPRRPSRWSCRAGRGGGGCRPTSWPSSSPSCAPATCGTARRRAMLAQRLAHAVLTKMEEAGESPDDRVQDAVARSAAGPRDGRPALAGRRPGAGRDAAARRPGGAGRAPRTGCSTTTSSGCCCGRSRPAGRRRRRWTLADAVLVDEAADLVDREPSLGHVVLDEAQDLSPMQLRAVGRRCSTGVGDGARRHRAGHDAVGDRRLGRDAAPPRQAGRARRGARAAATACPRRSSTSPAGCCRTSRRASRAPSRCARTRAARRRARPPTVGRDGGRCGAARGARRAGLGRRHRRRRATSTALRRPPRTSPHVVLGDDDDGAARVDRRAGRAGQGPRVRPRRRGRAGRDRRRRAVARQGLRRLYVVLTRAVSGLTVVHAEPLPPRAGGMTAAMRHLADAWLRAGPPRRRPRRRRRRRCRRCSGRWSRAAPPPTTTWRTSTRCCTGRRAGRRGRRRPTSCGWPRGSTTPSTTRRPPTTRSAAPSWPTTRWPSCGVGAGPRRRGGPAGAAHRDARRRARRPRRRGAVRRRPRGACGRPAALRVVRRGRPAGVRAPRRPTFNGGRAEVLSRLLDRPQLFRDRLRPPRVGGAARRQRLRRAAFPAWGRMTWRRRQPGQKRERSDSSLPLSTYSAPGGLRQDPGRAAESPAEARTCGHARSRRLT